jgi:hypothetical protein
MTKKTKTIKLKCDFCKNSQVKGHLWLGGGDYVICPQCDGTQEVIMLECKVEPDKIFMPPKPPLLVVHKEV